MPICSPKMHWVVVWCEVNANRQCAFGCVVTITDDAIRNVEPTPDSKPWLTGCVLAMPICPVEVFGCLIQLGQLIVNDQLTPPINPALNLAEYSQLKRMRNTAWINRLLIRLSRMETT